MKKFYRIVTLLITFTFLTTYSPHKLNILPKNEKFFFKIQTIEVINNHLVKKSNIIKKLKNLYGRNIFFIKEKDVVTSLNSINFIERIEVKKKYPKSLIIKVYETKPVAILFKNKKKYILDSSSNLVPFEESKFKDNFPNVFGNNAEQDFINFSKQLKNNNFPIKRIKNFYYFQIDRWDLQLLNKQIIKFPPIERSKAIQQSVELLEREDFKNYNIIDLRIHGKIVVE